MGTVTEGVDAVLSYFHSLRIPYELDSGSGCKKFTFIFMGKPKEEFTLGFKGTTQGKF